MDLTLDRPSWEFYSTPWEHDWHYFSIQSHLLFCWLPCCCIFAFQNTSMIMRSFLKTATRSNDKQQLKNNDVSNENRLVKALFHDGEILREKFCLRNTDGCTWVILLNFLTLSAFAVSRIDFYSLAKRNFFSRNLICPYCACINSFRANFFRISPRKSSRGIKP